MGNGVEGKGNTYTSFFTDMNCGNSETLVLFNIKMRTLYYCKFERIHLKPRRFLLKIGILLVVVVVIKKAMEYGIGLCLNLCIRLTVKKCIRVVNFLNIYKTIIAEIDLFYPFHTYLVQLQHIMGLVAILREVDSKSNSRFEMVS